MNKHMTPIFLYLNERFGPDAVQAEGEDQISLAVDERLILLHHFEVSEKLLMATGLAPLPENGREQLCLALLQGQYFFHKTSGMTLAVDTEARFVVLQLCVDADAKLMDDFATILENFVHVAAYWAETCRQLGEGAASPSAEVPLDLLTSGLRV